MLPPGIGSWAGLPGRGCASRPLMLSLLCRDLRGQPVPTKAVPARRHRRQAMKKAARRPFRCRVQEGLRGLLNRRDLPRPAVVAAEGPDLGDLLRLVPVAVDDASGGAVEGHVLEAVAHGDARIVGRAFAPRLGEVALDETHIRDLVDRVVARVVVELLLEVARHLGRREVPQRRHVLAAIGRLDVVKRLLEGGVFLRTDADLVGALAPDGLRGRGAHPGAEAADAADAAGDRPGRADATERRALIAAARAGAGEGRLRPGTAPEEAHREVDQAADERHLEQQAEDRGETAEAAEEAAPEQGAEKPGAEQSGHEASAEAELALRLGLPDRSARTLRLDLAGRRLGALDRRRRRRCGAGRGRRVEGARAARAEAAAA